MRLPAALIIVVAMAVGLAACSGESADPEETTTSADTSSSVASDYPTEEITMVIPFPAGGGLDVTHRALADIAEQELGQPIVAVNREGASGTIGVTEVFEAEPDGYTIGATGSLTVLVQPRVQDLSYSGPEDITPILQAKVAPTVLVVSPETGITSIEEFVQAAGEAETPLKMALPGGANTVADVQSQLLLAETGIEYTPAFFDVGQIAPSLLNGTIDTAIVQPSVIQQFAETGDIVVIGAFGDTPIPGFEDVPLLIDAGYPSLALVAYEFIYGPPGMPDEIVTMLHDAFKNAMDSEEFQTYAMENSIVQLYRGSEELGDVLAEDFENLAGVIAP